jgi:hypothetical protein
MTTTTNHHLRPGTAPTATVIDVSKHFDGGTHWGITLNLGHGSSFTVFGTPTQLAHMHAAIGQAMREGRDNDAHRVVLGSTEAGAA